MNRKLFIMFICFLAMSLEVLAQQSERGKAFLQHNGEIVRIYAYNEIDKAINDASEGDTIFLSKGLFQNGFTINKSISIIGTNNFTETTSDGTVIDLGGVETWNYIKEPNGKVIPSVTIEGVHFGTTLQLETPVRNLTLKQCYFLNELYINSNAKDMEKITIDRCYFYHYLKIPYGSTKTSISNCYIESLRNDGYANGLDDKLGLNTWVNHCTIYNLWEDISGVFQNCIIEKVNYGNSDFVHKPYFVNTLYYKGQNTDPFATVNLQDCWAATEQRIVDKTKEELLKDNYIGTDGTVVGKDGGETPYTLIQNRPQVTVKEFKADVDNRKVSVNVTTE